MIDPIGSKPVSPFDKRVAPVAAGAPAANVAPVADPRDDAAAASSVAEAARRAAAQPPIDHDRVAVLRAAIASGDYRPAPQAIADKMLGARQEWIAK
ncbi:MAG: flagellar biosynthesis anti-sigma factor FlgM [Sphingomonas sp.]